MNKHHMYNILCRIYNSHWMTDMFECSQCIKLCVKALHGVHTLFNSYHNPCETVTGTVPIFTDEEVESLEG